MHDVIEPTRVLGIAGSLRAGSYNRLLLRAAAQAAPIDMEVVPWEGLKDIPPFDEDDEFVPGPAVERLRAAIGAAHALLVVTPEYNGGLPGQLKNALDWASRPRHDAVLRDKPVAVIGASPSPGGARHAQADARRVLTRAGATVLDIELAIARVHTAFDADGRLLHADLRARLGAVVDALARDGASRASEPGADREPVLA